MVSTILTATAQQTVRGRIANPHGPLRIPCENCHTTTAWKPIRTQPEFRHNTQTTFALRGMHQGVQCRDCHIDLQFSKASTRCSDCHADLHRGQFGGNCQDCHTVQGWKVAVSAVRQHNNRFPLLGAHSSAACQDCHQGAASGRFTGLSTQCVSCHLRDYQRAQPLNHAAANLPVTCDTCHGMDGWQGARFDHARFTTFTLSGAHAQLECAACHVAGRFQGTPSDCFGCHVNDFTRVQDPNHAAAGFSHDCAVCHATNSWANAKFDHNTLTQFALTGAHVSVTCAQCHVAGRYAGTPADCVGCHLPDFNKTTNPSHIQGGFSTACGTCHTTAEWQGAKFDHSTSRFPLTGAHATVACAQCHVNGNFTSTPLECAGCHLADFQKATSPNHTAAAFPQNCVLCHNTIQWQGARFDHNAATKFALTGAHAALACAQCHANGVFAGTPMQCVGCHIGDFQKTTTPSHAAENFSQDCATCHNTSGWQGASFNHNQTPFPLTGTHTSVPCAQCHISGRFAGTPTDCAGCHLADFQKATSPNHAVGGFPKDCAMCHTTLQWQGAKFDHTALTKFALTGAHATVPCAQCHVNGVFAGTPVQCAGCHLSDFQKTTNPNHIAGGFSQDCAFCHTTAQWKGAKFDHSKTPFVLTGAHASVACAQCHLSGQFAGTTVQCFGCHANDYNTAASPNHRAAGFPQDCAVCHNTSQWKGATFDHSSTGFALTGAHTAMQCAQCHVNNTFTLTSAACVTCHLNDYNSAAIPNHKTAGFPQDCAGCHNTTQWKGATFNHASTGFPLTGAHAAAPCTQCHVNNNFNLSSAACAGCHLSDYNRATNPPHKASGFPQDCALCHNSAQWQGAAFNHTSTGFALTGAHTSVLCAQCHVNNNYNLTTAACAACHLTDYNNTISPNHKAAAFPQDCAGCHNTTQWKGAAFNHTTTGFALNGAHVSVQCAQCHINNDFSLNSAACAACHLNDYNGTTAPSHKAAGLPQDCTLCHNTNQWKGATFNHAATGFVLTGAHASAQCQQCHVSNNYNLTSTACSACHLNDYNGANAPPHKASGFPQDCSVCHNTTQWMGATFNHATTGFALTGAHIGLQCAQCHVNNNYGLTTAACATCHLTDYNNTTSPNHKASGFPQDCTGCHNTTQWKGATFNHTSTGFALTGAHTSVQCAQCHINNNYNLTTAACATCHLADYNNAISPNHKTAGFPQDCTTCHNTTQWKGATFNHTTTGFALTGAHTSLQCAQCHVNNNYNLTSTACASCHLTDYNNAASPNHKAAGFPQDCAGCHNTTQWKGATFNHTATGFALTGAHTSVQCAQCHVNSNFSLNSTACASCHLNDYNSANAPPHKTAGFPQDCTLCHNTTQWNGATFNHATTGFTLTGAHTSLQCSQCHVSNNYKLTGGACSGCHLSDYNGTTSPPHKSAGFPTDCSGCHSTTNWAGATFNHTSTGFALSGMHASISCAQCHVNGNFSLTSGACNNCHLTDYNSTTSPAHKAAGFPLDCSICHSTTNWSGATFTHPSTPFALTGFHASMLANNQCGSCHVGNVFTGTPTDCYSCHKTEFTGTTDPNHVAAAFPTTCGTCHTTTNWTGAKYTAHDSAYFPIYSGKHNGKWSACADCHTNSSNYSVFSCIVCHEHSNETSVTREHSGVKSFVYNGTSCYSCHPKGSGG